MTEYLVGIQSAHFIAVIQLFCRLGLVIGNLNSVEENMYFWFTDVNKTQNFLTLNRTRTFMKVVVNMHIYIQTPNTDIKTRSSFWSNISFIKTVNSFILQPTNSKLHLFVLQYLLLYVLQYLLQYLLLSYFNSLKLFYLYEVYVIVYKYTICVFH